MKYLVATLLVLATPAFAQHHDHDRGGPGIHFDLSPGGRHYEDHDRDHRPDAWAGGRFVGFGRHFWQGRWYDYGVGDCWAVGPDGRWWFVCGD
jgi:hypothetical protein